MAQKISITTPKGRAVYPWLNKPDTKFNADGVYKTGIAVSADEAKALVSKLDQIALDEFGKNKADKAKLPYKVDEETGDVVFNLKSQYPPKMWDTEGNPIANADAPALFGGSVIKASGAVRAYDTGSALGLGLYLNHVLVIEPVGGGQDAADNPFGSSEEGFIISNKNNEDEDAPFETDEDTGGDF